MTALPMLPFVDWDRITDGGYWTLPRNGCYSGGTLAGEACARAYMKQLRRQAYFNGGTLQAIALDMARSLAECTTDSERDAVRGQFVGFFGTIEELIQPLTRRLRELESVPYDELLEDVLVGLKFGDDGDDDVAVDAEYRRRARREAARRGWLTRRQAA